MECPGDVVLREVVGAVGRVPGVLAVGPGQLGGEGGDEVVEGPGHDGVVVEGGVKGDDAGGVANPWGRGGGRPSVKGSPTVKDRNGALKDTAVGEGKEGLPLISSPRTPRGRGKMAM